MQKLKNLMNRRWTALLITAILLISMTPTALADTGDSTPKITQQPDQLFLQLGTRWAGVEFELRTDAGIFPVSVVVDETGVLRMDLGGSTAYTLSCIESSMTIPAPDPEPKQDIAADQPSSDVSPHPQQTEPAPIISSTEPACLAAHSFPDGLGRRRQPLYL